MGESSRRADPLSHISHCFEAPSAQERVQLNHCGGQAFFPLPFYAFFSHFPVKRHYVTHHEAPLQTRYVELPRENYTATFITFASRCDVPLARHSSTKREN